MYNKKRVSTNVIFAFFIITLLLLTSCATTIDAPINGKSVPNQQDQSSFEQLAKSDSDRMADIEMREHLISLKVLMIKLYKRNPDEYHKHDAISVEALVNAIFTPDQTWDFEEINHSKDIAAIHLAFTPEFTGDRVLALITGLQTMLIKSHGGNAQFYATTKLEAQNIYNAARNIEIAVWKLSNNRDANGKLFLVSNEINAKEQNLSFEREFGKMIGRTDLFAITLAEKSQRLVTRIIQNFATALFLPF